MSLEYELQHLNEERLLHGIAAISDQAQNGRTVTSMITTEMQEKYPQLFSLIDELQGQFIDSAYRNEIAPDTAVSMAIGARIGIIALINHAEAEAYNEQFGTDQDH